MYKPEFQLILIAAIFELKTIDLGLYRKKFGRNQVDIKEKKIKKIQPPDSQEEAYKKMLN